MTTRSRIATVNGQDIAYRDEGNPNGPVLLLLHGFPGSSNTFSPLIAQLPRNLRLIAPDYPGFGASANLTGPATFDSLADNIEKLLAQLHVETFALYMFDFGAPVGMRLLENDMHRVNEMIFQNANIYAEGLGPGFAGLRSYWEAPDKVLPRLRSALLSADGITAQHEAGAVRPQLLDRSVIDQAIEDHSGPARQQAVLDLLLDYEHNVAAYRHWQDLVAASDAPVLALWGKYDPIFTTDGALGFAAHARHLSIVLLDAGHFAALEQPAEVAHAVQQFLHATHPPEVENAAS